MYGGVTHAEVRNNHCRYSLDFIFKSSFKHFSLIYSKYLIIIKRLDPLRAKKTFIRKKLDHTAVSAIKAFSVTLQIWQNCDL